MMAAATVGLSGQDRALDRTAAIRWAPRRAAHVLLIGVLAGAVLLALLAAGDEPVRAGIPVRNSAGPAGLAAIGAAAWGGVAAQVTTWLLRPSGASVACWTAVALAAGGGRRAALRAGRAQTLNRRGADPVRPRPRR
ncbi:hypothetical protein ACFXKS_10890 [Streptomyces scopuliridis]|uniref:hypothetical protein n=1 Tax=Streptomyces scopuliridis TaxID=452529 RepID=UPI0036999852